jgi:peptide/nickel transport system permease protein
MRVAATAIKRLGRLLVIVFLVLVGSTVLVRFAPGYFSDVREMDGRYRATAQAELSAEAARSGSLVHVLSTEILDFTHGDAGRSRQYGIPVLELIRPRLAITGELILRAIIMAWVLALSTSLLSSASRRPSLKWHAPATLLLAVPTAAMATLCLLVNSGGPVLVMSLLLAARDFKFLDRVLRQSWSDPHVLQARAQGIRTPRILLAHILPGIRPQLSALATFSIVTALGAVVPVEVIFNVPGLGQLAWNAALNRDLPVLLAVTMIMALAVTFAGMLSDQTGEWESV